MKEEEIGRITIGRTNKEMGSMGERREGDKRYERDKEEEGRNDSVGPCATIYTV